MRESCDLVTHRVKGVCIFLGGLTSEVKHQWAWGKGSLRPEAGVLLIGMGT